MCSSPINCSYLSGAQKMKPHGDFCQGNGTSPPSTHTRPQTYQYFVVIVSSSTETPSHLQLLQQTPLRSLKSLLSCTFLLGPSVSLPSPSVLKSGFRSIIKTRQWLSFKPDFPLAECISFILITFFSLRPKRSSFNPGFTLSQATLNHV